MKHDFCRATEKFKNAGQNLYFKRSRPIFMPLNTTVIASVKSWHDEILLTNQSDFNKCCGGDKFDSIAHVLNMLQDKITAVGCAVVTYTCSQKWRTYLIACNYSYGNLEGEPVYEIGDAASKCDQKDPYHPALCIPKEGMEEETLEFVNEDEEDEVEMVYVDDNES
jgi:Cysteine-rich secretory protein family